MSEFATARRSIATLQEDIARLDAALRRHRDDMAKQVAASRITIDESLELLQRVDVILGQGAWLPGGK